MRITAHRLAIAAALIATALGLSGCSSGCTCPDEVEDIYPARTSPQNVIEKLRLAYVNMDADAYVDCLADDFTFHVNPRIAGNPDLDVPETWDRTFEETIHRAMFAENSSAERVALTLTTVSKEWNESDGLWRYTEAPDVRVTVTGDLTFYANSPQRFVLAIDEDRTGRDGEELWAIVEWHDLEESWTRPGEDSTWSSIKWLWYSWY